MRVIIIDNGETKRRVSIEEALRDQARALDLDIELVDDDGSSPKPGDFVVYLGRSLAPSAPAVHVANHDGRLLPVIVTPDDARHLPPELAPINAFIQERYGAEWPHGVVDEVLARTFLRRTNRRVWFAPGAFTVVLLPQAARPAKEGRHVKRTGSRSEAP